MKLIKYTICAIIIILLLFTIIAVFAINKQNSAPFNTQIIKNITNIRTYLPENKDKKLDISLIMFGDMMLDRDILAIAKKQNNFAYHFEQIDSIIENADIAIVNLEGPITEYQSIATENGALRFTISEKFIPEISKRFYILSLANNHMLDFSQNGLDQTRKFLSEANVKTFGDPQNNKNNLSTIITKNQIAIGLIGYHNLWKMDTEIIENEIKKIRKSVDFIIIYPHWGIEYNSTESNAQQKEAHAFIDAGADLIIGSHPHVVQPMEIYKNKVIFYSIGNFVFDQYWSEQTLLSLGVGLNLEKNKDKIKQIYYLHPIKINKKGQPTIANEKEEETILKTLEENSSLSESIKYGIKNKTFLITSQ